MTASLLTPNQLTAVHALLDEVAARQRQDSGHIISDHKPDGTLITACDRWSNTALVQGIAELAASEGVLSEEGSQYVPYSNAFWVVDPLDGTTNFAAGIPYWAISVARFIDGTPSEAFLDIPSLRQRIVAIRGRGVWRNGKPITAKMRRRVTSACVSFCSRSIRILQQRPGQLFPGKIRLLGVTSLNLTSVTMGQTVAALEATPKIWDLAAAWLILSELNCSIQWLNRNPSQIYPGENLSNADFPVLVAGDDRQLEQFLPWAAALMA